MRNLSEITREEAIHVATIVAKWHNWDEFENDHGAKRITVRKSGAVFTLSYSERFGGSFMSLHEQWRKNKIPLNKIFEVCIYLEGVGIDPAAIL